MRKKVTVGVIGAGRIGKLHVGNLVHRIPEAFVKTVADIRADDLNDWASELGIKKLTPDYIEILDDPDIDAVIICSSTDTHARFIIEAARSGKDIFCEKPIDFNVAKINDALSAVDEAGVKLMIGFNRRFDHNFSRVKDSIVSGEIGDIHLVKITSRDPAPPPIEYIKVSGGLFFDMTIHDWDMARFLSGSEVREVFANGCVLIDDEIGKAGDIDTAVAILNFENGAFGIIDNSRQAVYGYDQRVEVFGSKGAAIAENDKPNSVKLFKKGSTLMDPIPYFFLERYNESYVTEMKEFIHCIIDDKKPPVSGIDGLNAVLIAMAAKKSMEENRPVKISEISK
ncbi:MAG: inositol 2-dehydrogenase [Promethearchaeota archaeon]